MTGIEKYLATALDRKRKGRRALLLPHAEAIKSLVDANVSLTQVNQYLREQDKAVTVSQETLRNFVIAQWGEPYYRAYTDRNGWSKSKARSKAVVEGGARKAVTVRDAVEANEKQEVPASVVEHFPLSNEASKARLEQYRRGLNK